MLYLTRSRESELPQLYKLERLCHSYPWTLGILQDCLRVGYLCHTFQQGDVFSEESVDVAIKLPSLVNNSCCSNPIGFMINQIILDECHLLNICVHPTMQGKGIAFTVLTWLINFMREKQIKTMLLEVRVSNHAAIRLYEKLGFQQIGVRKNYYFMEDGREDARVLKLQL